MAVNFSNDLYFRNGMIQIWFHAEFGEY